MNEVKKNLSILDQTEYNIVIIIREHSYKYLYGGESHNTDERERKYVGIESILNEYIYLKCHRARKAPEKRKEGTTSKHFFLQGTVK
jgi:hypothetical protein